MLDVTLDKRPSEQLLDAITSPAWENGVKVFLLKSIEKRRDSLENGDCPETRGEIRALRKLMNMTVTDVKSSTR